MLLLPAVLGLPAQATNQALAPLGPHFAAARSIQTRLRRPPRLPASRGRSPSPSLHLLPCRLRDQTRRDVGAQARDQVDGYDGRAAAGRGQHGHPGAGGRPAKRRAARAGGAGGRRRAALHAHLLVELSPTCCSARPCLLPASPSPPPTRAARQALDKFTVEKDVAAFIKKEFDQKHNPTWHCIVGRNFGACAVRRRRQQRVAGRSWLLGSRTVL